MNEKRIFWPMPKAELANLRAGCAVKISGKLYTARDAAHKRMAQLLDTGTPLPFEINGALVYYTGPCPAKPGEAIGPCGPTTSSRMDLYTPRLLDMGLTGMMGKGGRSDEVIASMIKNGAVYFACTGGAAVLLMQCVKSCRPVAFGELLSEAVFELEVENFPAVVAIDSAGNSLYNA